MSKAHKKIPLPLAGHPSVMVFTQETLENSTLFTAVNNVVTLNPNNTHAASVTKPLPI